MLVERLRRGEDVEHELILCNMRLAYSVAHRFIRTNKHLQDDILDVALLALCVYVCKVKEKLIDDNIGKYLAVNIRLCIIDYLTKSAAIVVPFGTPKINVLELQDSIATRVKVDECSDILELLRLICESDIETDVVELKLAGRRQNEIGEIMGVTKGYVSQILKRLKIRFFERWE